MNTENKKEEATLFASSHPEIVKKMSYKSAILVSLYMEVGIVLLIISYLLNEKYNTLSMLSIVVGVILIIVGLYKVLYRSKREVYLPTGSVVEKKIFFFDSKQSALLQEYINNGDFPSLAPIQSVPNGCVKMEVLKTSDGQFAGAQLFEFEPYVYSPVTSIHYYKDEKADLLNKFVKSIKSKSA